MAKIYSCSCGFSTEDTAEFSKHLLTARWEGGTHKSLNPTAKYKQSQHKRRKTEVENNETETKEAGKGADFTRFDSKPGAVTFKFKAETIQLNPTDLFEAYVIYNDLKTRHGIENSFSDFLKAGSEIIWSLMQRPQIPEGVEDG
jgi:hypothetical protein